MPRKKQTRDLPHHPATSGKASLSKVKGSGKTLRDQLTTLGVPSIDRYLGGPWKMHLPFAYHLMRELKPRVFVELGVYKGESYFAFCQSVHENNLATECYGVDTWQGDLHAGLYCAEFGEEVAAHNSRYARFSHLMAMTFKEAAKQFQDRSIDFLHIDGAHRYEDVKKDFEMWRPKLSENGIVLFHDVMEREREFGVYRLWEEIARPRASFLFEFGHGLGVWKARPVTKDDAPFLRRLFLASAHEREIINRHYATMAEEVELAGKAASNFSEDRNEPTYLQVFGSRDGAQCEEYSSTIEILSGRWCRPKIDLPWGLGDGSAPLRLDPVNRIALVNIALISLRSRATGEILWRADRRGGLEQLTVRGTGLRLPHPRLFRLLSYADDPQVCLPHLTGDQFQEPLTLEILLRFDLAAETIDRAVTAWNESDIPVVRTLSPPAEQVATAAPPDPSSALGPEDGKITMVVYSAGESGYSEGRSTHVTYTAQRWSHLDIALDRGLGSKPLRVDPLTAIGLVDIAAITIRSAISGEILWRTNGGGGLEALQISGSAVRIPHPHLARILSYGEDPQIFLPAFPSGEFDGPLRLELWLKTEIGFDSIRKGISELATISSQALAATGQTRGLLEQSTRDASHKDTEIQSLRIELKRDVSERALQIENLRTSLEARTSEAANQQAHIQNLETIRSEQELEIKNLRTSLEAKQSETGSQQAHISNLEAIRTQLESEAAALHQSLDKTKAEAAQFLAQLETEQADHLKVQADMRREREAGASNGEKQIESLKVLLEGAQLDCGRVSNDRARVTDELARAFRDLASRTSELVKFRQELALAKNELIVAASEVDQSREELVTQNAELASRRREIDRVRKEFESQGVRLDQARNELAGTNRKFLDLANEVSSLTEQLQAERAAKAGLVQELGRTREKMDSLSEELTGIKESSLWKYGNRFRKLGGRDLAAKAPAQRTEEASVKKGASSHKFWIDSPSEPSVEGQGVTVSGWVLPAAGEKIFGIRAVTNGGVFLGHYGWAREDVATAFIDRADATHAGFTISLEATLSVGIHDIALQVITTGSWATFCVHRHKVQQATDDGLEGGPKDFIEVAPVSREESPGNAFLARVGIDFEGTLETPPNEVTNEHGLLLVTGWLYLKTAKMVAFTARLDDGGSADLAHSLPRADVARHLPEFPSARDSGFEGYIPIDTGFSGRRRLEIEAVLADGTRMRCFHRDLIIRLPETARPADYPVDDPSDDERYARWIRTNRLTPYLLKAMTRDASLIAKTGPQISIVVPTFNPPAPYLEALIESVRGQLYPNWQLCLADDASTQPHVRAILERAAAADSRIDVVFREINGHIVKASNSALALAKGDYVGLLDHDDLLTPDALLHVAEAIVSERALDVLYTDEDKLSPEGKRYDPIFKGSFSPEMSLTHNYIQHFTVMRRSLLEEVGCFREGFEGAQDLDLYLRVLEKTTPERVRHLPFVCYHWRSHPESTASSGGQKNYVFDSARKSIAENLKRQGIRAVPYLPAWAGKANCCLYQLKWSPDLLKENPVTIVIPTKNRSDLLEKCLASLERTVDSAYVNVIIVDDFSEEESTRSYLKQLSSRTGLRCRVIQPRSRLAEFNFSQLINEGVAAATTTLVLLLNNDTEALNAGWLEEMVGWMSIKGVGAVGAKLLYPDHTIQHAGVIVGSHGGLADHIFHRLPQDVIGFNFLTHAARNVSAVTGACMLTSKAAFDEVGGFDQDALGMEYNDVDFCLRLGRAGKRVVFTPQATLLHHCAQSRGEGWRPREHLSFLRRYQGIKDPYYNENLDLNRMPAVVNPSHFIHQDRVGKLKVLMISHNLNLEGAPKVLFDHAAYFASMGGYDVTMVSREDGPLRGQMEEAGIPVRIVEGVLPRRGENTLDYTERLREIGADLEANSYDLVVCNTLTSFWGVAMAGLFHLPVIWHIHESTTLDQFFYHDPVPKGLVESCLAAADRVVFEANATRQLFRHYERRSNFTTISGSIDVGAIDKFRETHSQRSLKVKHGIDPDKIVVSLIGTTCPRKGQLVFVQAIELLQTKWPNDIASICFLMLGARECPYLDLLRAQLETIRKTDTRLVEEHPDVFDFYRLTDIFVCTSFQESFPRVILEAMAFKLPIISTDVFGIPEMVEHEGEGLLIPPGDPSRLAQNIEWLVQAPKPRKELGNKGHARVARLFNSPTQLSRQLDLTKEVVARHL